MATYVNDLRLKEIGTGESSGTWGTETNTNLELIGEALGFGTEAITTNADTHTTTVADGSTDPGRAMYIKYTGTLDSACTITIAPNTMSRMHFIENGTSGSQNIIISQGTGANVTIPAGDTKAVYLDGAGAGAAVVDAFASLNTVDLKVEDDLTVTDDLIVNGDIDLEGSIDVNGTANLDVVDIDGAVDMASTLQVDGAITSSTGATITVADNSDNLTLTSTDADANSGPNLRMYRNSGSPADNDYIGEIQFEGRNDNSQDVVYAGLAARILDASDGTEDGRFELFTVRDGSQISTMVATATELIFNNDSIDFDFRVESDDDANMFFLDSSANAIGMGTSTPNEGGFGSGSRVLSIQGSAADDFGVLELISPDVTSSNRIGEIRFGNLDGGSSFASNAGMRATRNGADNSAALSLWTTGAGTFAERLSIGHTGPLVTITDDGTDGYETLLKLYRSSASANEVGLQFDLTGSGGTAQACGIYAAKGEDWSSGTSRSATLNFQAKDDGTDQIMYQFGNFSDGVNEHRWLTAGAQAMRLNQSGTLAIQTTTQIASTALTVYSNGNYGIAIGSADSTNAYRRIYHTASSGIMSFDSTSNTATLTNAGAWTDASDISYKENITDINYGLDTVKSMQPRKYTIKSDNSDAIGFIAQEMEAIIPEVVNGEDGSKTLSYGQLTAVLVKAIQEQQTIIEDLKARIETLEG